MQHPACRWPNRQTPWWAESPGTTCRSGDTCYHSISIPPTQFLRAARLRPGLPLQSEESGVVIFHCSPCRRELNQSSAATLEGWLFRCKTSNYLLWLWRPRNTRGLIKGILGRQSRAKLVVSRIKLVSKRETNHTSPSSIDARRS